MTDAARLLSWRVVYTVGEVSHLVFVKAASSEAAAAAVKAEDPRRVIVLATADVRDP